MDIEFRTKKLQKICNIEKQGIRELGDQCARKLRARMEDLASAECLEDLRNVPGTGHVHPLTGDRGGQFSIELKHPYRLIFVPILEAEPEDANLDWNEITSIEIIEIVDYH